MKISTCLSTNPTQFSAVPFKGELEDNVIEIKKVGFDGIELAIRDPRIIDQENIISTIKDAGLSIPGVGTGQAWVEEGLSFTHSDESIRKKAVERIHYHIEFAKKADSIILIGLLRGSNNSGGNQQREEDYMLECFSQCCAAAEKENVRIAIEPLNRYETCFLNTVDSILDFADKVGASNLGLLLDIFHMNIEEPSIVESIRKAGEKIYHFHYADSNRWYPGAGHIDFLPILKALKETSYQGFLSGEHMPNPDPLTAVVKGLKHIREIGKELDM